MSNNEQVDDPNVYYRKLALWAGYALAALATIAANALITRWIGPSAPALPAPPPPVLLIQHDGPESQSIKITVIHPTPTKP